MFFAGTFLETQHNSQINTSKELNSTNLETGREGVATKKEEFLTNREIVCPKCKDGTLKPRLISTTKYIMICIHDQQGHHNDVSKNSSLTSLNNINSQAYRVSPQTKDSQKESFRFENSQTISTMRVDTSSTAREHMFD